VISREDLIDKSVREFARQYLVTRGYGPDKLRWIESFPHSLESLDGVSLAAVGFNFDDEGREAEMGSSLTERNYTIEFFVFGVDMEIARNVANWMKFALESDEQGTLPLMDYGQDPPVEIDRLRVDGVSTHHQAFLDPEPWQEFTWLTTVRVEDIYYASTLA
jgi:hypothetical protein